MKTRFPEGLVYRTQKAAVPLPYTVTMRLPLRPSRSTVLRKRPLPRFLAMAVSSHVAVIFMAAEGTAGGTASRFLEASWKCRSVPREKGDKYGKYRTGLL